ncbi:hypothetical protein [Streptomyces sp. NRRL S-813]|uniref:hypothetical protein n=1 Tax=Streptomyces sp. NRRL S-813 TaxID=1463919 RepID=UPI001900ECFA|nr:hypothetical protein [Streptomyces sp. NRRL S-813]
MTSCRFSSPSSGPRFGLSGQAPNSRPPSARRRNWRRCPARNPSRWSSREPDPWSRRTAWRTNGTPSTSQAPIQDWIAAFGFEPTSAQFALWLQDQYGIATAAGSPLADEQLEPLLQLLKQRHKPGADSGTEPQAEHDADDGWGDYFYNAWLTYAQEHGAYPDAAALAAYVYERDQITGGNGRPITGADLEYFVSTFRQREFDEREPPADEEATERSAQVPTGEPLPSQDEPEETPAAAGARPAKETRSPRVSATVDEPPGEDDATGEPAALTTVDRYYLAGGSTRPSMVRNPRPSSSPPTLPARRV